MRCLPSRCCLLLALPTLLLAACGGGGSSTSSVVNQSITPCDGAELPTPDATPAFDVWQASFAPPTPRSTPTATPIRGTPVLPTATAAPTFTPQPNILAVSVDTVDSASASPFRLTVACQGTVVIPATTIGMTCTFPPPGDVQTCPSANPDLTPLGFGDFRRIGCLIEIGPTEPLGAGMCADPGHAGYRLKVTLNGQTPLSLTLAAHNCRAPESCLHDVFGIDVGSGADSD
jgi:hypothetical protein